MLSLLAMLTSCQRCGSHVKGEFPHFLIQVYLSWLSPMSGAFSNHALDEREVAFHIAVSECWIPQLAMPSVLRGIHVEQALPLQLPIAVRTLKNLPLLSSHLLPTS